MDELTDCNWQAKRLLSESDSTSPLPMQLVLDADRVMDYLTTVFTNLHQDDAIWKDCCYTLLDTVSNLQKVVNNLSKRMSELSDQNEKLEYELKIMKQKVHKLEVSELKLIIGQIAFLVDQDILKYVMEGIGEPNARSIYTIYHLEDAIENKKRFKNVFSEEERQIVRERWDTLKSDIGWKDKHYRDSEALKSLRIDSAHPQVSHEQLSEAIGKISSENKHLKAISKEFLAMLRKLALKNRV